MTEIMIGMLKLFYYLLHNLVPGVKKSDVGKLWRDYFALCKIFNSGQLRITDCGITVTTESGGPVEIRIEDDMDAGGGPPEVVVLGSITLKNRILMVKKKRLSIRKIGERKFFDGSLWIENTQYIGDMGSVENLNIISGGVIRGCVGRLGMLYIRDGTFIGSVGVVDRFIHITHLNGLFNGRIDVINETLFIENGAFITDRLPVIKGGYAILKEGRLRKPDGSRWGLDEIAARIGDLADDQEIFVSGCGGIALLGRGAASIVIKEGLDTYSRHKTETVINANRFFQSSGDAPPDVGDETAGVNGGALKEVRLVISENQRVDLPEGKFYTYVRLDIVKA
jgi:hypothetical protein